LEKGSEIVDDVKVGNYVVYNEEKIEKRLDFVKKLSGTYIFDREMKKLKNMKNDVYIIKGWYDKGKFYGESNGKKYCGLLASEFRIATLKEKIKYDLSQIYNK
jgi:hypothetical protein